MLSLITSCSIVEKPPMKLDKQTISFHLDKMNFECINTIKIVDTIDATLILEEISDGNIRCVIIS